MRSGPSLVVAFLALTLGPASSLAENSDIGLELDMGLLGARVVACEQAGSGFDEQLGRIEPRLVDTAGLGRKQRLALQESIDAIWLGKASIDACETQLRYLIDKIGRRVEEDSSRVVFPKLETRYADARRRVERVFGPEVRERRNSRLVAIQMRAEDLIE